MEVVDYDELQRLKLKMTKEEYELEKRKAVAVSTLLIWRSLVHDVPNPRINWHCFDSLANGKIQKQLQNEALQVSTQCWYRT